MDEHGLMRVPRLQQPGQDGQFDVVFGDEFQQLGLSLRLGFRCYRDVVERDAVEIGQFLKVAVVGDDGRNLDGQGSRALLEEQVVEAVRILGTQDDGAHLPANRVDLPRHAEGFGHRLQGSGQFRLGARRRCLHAHEEVAGGGASVLLRIGDIAPRTKECAGNSVDDAGTVGAGEGHNKSGVSHTIKPTRAALLYC